MTPPYLNVYLVFSADLIIILFSFYLLFILLVLFIKVLLLSILIFFLLSLCNGQKLMSPCVNIVNKTNVPNHNKHGLGCDAKHDRSLIELS